MQKEKPDPIDAEMQKRLDTGINMRGALSWAYQQWDNELNKAYHALLNSLPAHQKPLLVASQRAWLKYRDAEFAFMNDLLQYKQTPSGASAPSKLAMVGDSVDFVKARTLALRHYKPNPYQE